MNTPYYIPRDQQQTIDNQDQYDIADLYQTAGPAQEPSTYNQESDIYMEGLPE